MTTTTDRVTLGLVLAALSANDGWNDSAQAFITAERTEAGAIISYLPIDGRGEEQDDDRVTWYLDLWARTEVLAGPVDEPTDNGVEPLGNDRWTPEQRLTHAEYTANLMRGRATRAHQRADGLADEVTRLRQGLWDVARLAGADLDGEATPDALTYPDIVEFAHQAVRELRETYDSEATS